jgi:hypothetical protein
LAEPRHNESLLLFAEELGHLRFSPSLRQLGLQGLGQNPIPAVILDPLTSASYQHRAVDFIRRFENTVIIVANAVSFSFLLGILYFSVARKGGAFGRLGRTRNLAERAADYGLGNLEL